MGATGSHFHCVYTGSAAWVPPEPVADSQDHKRQRQAEKMVFSPMKKGANGSLLHTCNSALIAAPSLDQIADGHDHKHQQVGGEDGDKPLRHGEAQELPADLAAISIREE